MSRAEKAKQYFPQISQDETAVEETKNFLQKTFKGKLGLMINTMIKEEALSTTTFPFRSYIAPRATNVRCCCEE